MSFAAKKKALAQKFQQMGDKLTGTVRVDNGNNPSTPAYKVKHGGPPAKPFKSSLPNQEVYGAPGVTRVKQLSAKLK